MTRDLLEYEIAKGRIVLRILESCLGLDFNNAKVLEIGCSTGALMQLLDARGAYVYAVDVESPWSGFYCYKPERRIMLDIQQTDLPAEWQRKFDLVIAQEVIEHIKKPYEFLTRIWQALKPGGCLFLTTPNLTGITALLKGKKWCGLTTEGHVLLYSPKSLNFTVCNCGFRSVNTFTNLIPIVYQDSHPFLRRLNRVAARTKIGGGLMALYKKEDPADCAK